jgi:hypothetical protein
MERRGGTGMPGGQPQGEAGGVTPVGFLFGAQLFDLSSGGGGTNRSFFGASDRSIARSASTKACNLVAVCPFKDCVVERDRPTPQMAPDALNHTVLDPAIFHIR